MSTWDDKLNDYEHEIFLNGKVELHCGDMTAVLPTLASNSIDSCVCDPPYHLTNNKGARSLFPGQYTPIGKPKAPRGGFRGKQWDGGDIAFQPETWAQVYRVLKPGAHLIAFSSTRTYHRMACAIEDAGFEIRDQIGFCYGSGFPKSHNVGHGWGSALKPAWEPIVLARKPLSEKTIAANVLKWGTGAINIDGCRVEASSDHAENCARTFQSGIWKKSGEGRSAITTEANKFGRWPANIITDGSDEVVARFPETTPSPTGLITQGGDHFSIGSEEKTRGTKFQGHGDSGSAARFFYTAKANANDRLGSNHPTIKPIDLMQYLVRLVTPKDGLVLDPFAGTGTTAEAAWREGMRAVLIERETEYQDDIRRRMKLCLAGPDERTRESIKAKMKDKPIDVGPLFARG